ncbi:hypothetical protein LEP1GSC016_1619 [Leptospira borgpetersenii serovar Hardjo-bovis str. Sponselee]|uniref:Uncharacterized protein n=2 Tax=Leptospira borgpetersenii TaxID=174 RepID=M6BPF9_LEPBO|nr:hypothetical protein LEP1GSC016_1619 [Leptospira borgpetersenii serovar Hardjo-bovis str. Sponselee]EMO61155.1 hypothetical protein LEP1GSC133_1377 [Leptospira borgpetersenii serovar Pomona str. 200901868]
MNWENIFNLNSYQSFREKILCFFIFGGCVEPSLEQNLGGSI